MDKKIFILPGFKQKATDPEFAWIEPFFQKKGFSVVPVPIRWNYRTITDNVAEFKDFYEKNKSKNNYALGFSYGAIIAFISANNLGLKKLYLCSLSPDFKEDLAGMKPWILKYIGKKRVEDMKKRSGRDIAKKLSVPTLIFYGEKEGKEFFNLKKRCEETANLAKRARLIIVKGAPHDISYPGYIETIKKEFQ
jgi:pimeloyl-ACP methyl ester carboxylesterase